MNTHHFVHEVIPVSLLQPADPALLFRLAKAPSPSIFEIFYMIESLNEAKFRERGLYMV